MSDIASAQLPFDVQVQILKEYMRLWPTRIPSWNSRFLLDSMCIHYPSTNRATLVDGNNRKTRNKPLDGWIVLPIPPFKQGVCFEQNFETVFPPDRSGWFAQKRWASKAEFRLDEILGLFSSSKAFSNPLQTFFFGSMIWQFHSKSGLDRIYSHRRAYGPNHRPLPLQHIMKIKNISLSSEFSGQQYWPGFSRLFQKMYDIVSQSSNGFRGLQFLELLMTNSTYNWGPEVVHGYPILSRRIRYLVTHCYLMVQKRRGLIICLRCNMRPDARGSTWHSATVENVEPEANQSSEQDCSAGGFSKNEVQEFLDGTWALLRGLKSIEFGHIADGPRSTKNINSTENLTVADWPQIWWQMVFAREWSLIFEKGVRVKEKDGGYAAVYDSGVRDW